MRYRTETRVVAKLQEIPISDMVLAKVQAPCKYVLCNDVSYEQLQHYFTKQKKEAAELWEERKKQNVIRREYIHQKQAKQKRFQQYKRYLHHFNIEVVSQRMSYKEQVLFKQLIKEYGLTDNNFPGIFNIQI